MYSSVTNGEYSELYYDILMTPVRINNRVALLTSDNPFMLNLLGVRYLETTAGHIPAGYEPILKSGENVIVENPDVLPSVYFTDDTVSQEWFDTLDSLPKLDIITRKTVVEDSSREGLQDSSTSSSQSSSQNGAAEGSAGNNMRPYSPELSPKNLPEDLDINRTDSGWEIRAEKECTLTLDIGNPQPGSIVLCQFEVENLTTQAVVIDINNIRNKLSGMFAPYPNGNDQFHYQFSTDSSTGVDRLEITFSKGHYRLNDIQWYLYDQSLLNEKNYAPLTADQSTGSGSTGIMDTKYTITAENNGYLVTSIPMQNGLEILVDGKPSDLVRVNQAFAGTYLEKGEHTIEFCFSPPGKTAGCAVSTAVSIGYVVYLLYTFLLQTKRNIGRNCL